MDTVDMCPLTKQLGGRLDYGQPLHRSRRLTLPPLDEQTLTELRQRYDDASDAETRIRYQMLLLSARGQTSTQIAAVVLRSQDTIVRVLKGFLTGGVEAVPRRTAPGRDRTITQAWESDLLLADVQSHFQALTQNPADVLRHSGSLFAPDKDKDITQPETLAA
jgi:Winged helix-turn helix